MMFTPHHCPTCTGIAVSVLERLYGQAQLDFDDGPEGREHAFDYAGETEVDWDSQTMEESIDEDGRSRVTVFCDRGHHWDATLEGEAHNGELFDPVARAWYTFETWLSRNPGETVETLVASGKARSG